MTRTRKCIVWDLDDTLWDGKAIEGSVQIRWDVIESIRRLKERGILHSIASKGNPERPLEVLEEAGLADLFLCPQISWNWKTTTILDIARKLDLSLDSMAFVDNEPFELEQMTFMHPEVLTIPADRGATLESLEAFSPVAVTDEAKNRHRSYKTELQRQEAEKAFPSREAFLVSCGMVMAVRKMAAPDVPRVMELMQRTHRLNSSGLVMDEVGLLSLIDPGSLRRMYVAGLKDRFGDYGLIGSALTESGGQSWRLKFFAMSCRVMGRGVERAFLSALVHGVAEDFEACEAEFRDTDSNVMLRTMYQRNGLISIKVNLTADGIS